ncbi:MAG: THUMP domain-containing protein [Promethearchaeota archaeon]
MVLQNSSSYPAYLKRFNLILGRYVEIGLKSDKVRTRMEYRLLDYIQNLCNRENIELQGIFRRYGRLLFHMDYENLLKALDVFQYAIGLYGYSPGFSCEKDYAIITEKIVDFASEYLNDGDSFAMRVKRVKPYPKTSLEMERELGSAIWTHFDEQGMKLHVNLTNPDKTIFLEVRTHKAYIYCDQFKTIWGGNPFEIDKTAISLWRGRVGEGLAMQLMMRRGTFVIPVICLSTSEMRSEFPQIQKRLQSLAKYTPEGLNTLLINPEALWEMIDRTEFTSVECESLRNYGYLALMNELKNQINEEKTFHFKDRIMRAKGIITGVIPTDPEFSVFGTFHVIPHFMPIAGFSKEQINTIENRIYADEFEPDKKGPLGNHIGGEFHIADAILTQTRSMQSQKSSIESSKELNKDLIDKIENFYDSEEIKDLITVICQNRTKMLIEGKILR